jgi:hypothetical protein
LRPGLSIFLDTFGFIILLWALEEIEKGRTAMSLMNATAMFKEIDALERKRAEMLYATAVASAQSGYSRVAKGFAEECILLLRKIGTNTYQECATGAPCLEGVTMPDFLHEGVVRERLKTFGIEPAA